MVERPSSSTSSVKTTQYLDWNALRDKSLQPGGFGADRVEIWPQLLGVSDRETAVQEDDENKDDDWESLSPHRDERQIRLDTDRSFVLYSGVTPDSSFSQSGDTSRERHQTSLNSLLNRLFRRHPKLSYFQGFHDISTVIYLTIPDTETQYRCLEKMSLQRLRDSMGKGLEPVLGLVRITRNLLRLCSPDYARTLEQTSPLPFYSLSNLLTLFSHDMPTLELIQHVFDWLLAREPVACVYLVTAILLARRPDLDRLREDDDDEDIGMTHSVLSTLPLIVDSLDAVKEESNEPGHENENDQEAKTKPEGEETPQVADGRTEPLVEIKAEEVNQQELTSSAPLASSGAGVGPQTTEAEPSEPPSPPSPSSSPFPTHPHQFPRTHPRAPPPKPQPLSLTTLLRDADRLMEEYPPTHPSLKIREIMGPKSVVFTWTEKFEELPAEEEVEGWASERLEEVVLPFVEEPEEEEEEEEEVDEEKDELDLISEKPGRHHRRRSSTNNSLRNRLRKPRRQWYLSHRRQAIVTTTVVVLGVALAVYGTTESRGGLGPREREWRKLIGWVVDVVLGA